LKLLFSRAAQLYCRRCAAPVKSDSPQSIHQHLGEHLQALGATDARLAITFPVPVPDNFSEDEVLGLLASQGYTRVFSRTAAPATTSTAGRKRGSKAGSAEGAPAVVLEMIQDRVRFATAERERLIEAF